MNDYQYQTELLVERGNQFYHKAEYDRAIDFYTRALEMDIANVEALEGLGQSHAGLNNWPRAVSAFEQLLAADPNSGFAHYILGHACGATGDHDRALRELKKALDLRYGTADVHSAIGYSLHMKGDMEGAMGSYRLALDLDPDDTITMFNLGKALVDTGNLLAARRVLEDAVEVDPEDSQSWLALGEVYEDLDEWERALEAYERTIQLDPDSSDARCLSAHVYLMLGRADEAEWQYKQVIADNPAIANAWAGLGEVLISQERYHEALSACHKALEVDSSSPYALSGYVSACEQIGAFEDARVAVSTALGKDPDSPDLWYLLAGINASEQMLEQALDAYEKAVQLNPKDPASHAGVGWALIELDQDATKAEAHLKESLRLAPDWYYPCLQLGELYLQNDDRSLAAEWFSKAWQMAPDDPEVIETLSDPEIRDLLDNGRPAI